MIFAVEQVVFLSLVSGSPGHLLLGMRVVPAKGGRLGLWRPLVRTILLCLRHPRSDLGSRPARPARPRLRHDPGPTLIEERREATRLEIYLGRGARTLNGSMPFGIGSPPLPSELRRFDTASTSALRSVDLILRSADDSLYSGVESGSGPT